MTKKDETMKYDLIVIGNDEAAFEMLTLASFGKRRILAVLPEMRHSSWFMSQALRRLASELLADRSPDRCRLLQKCASPRLLRSMLTRAVAQETQEQARFLKKLGVDVVIGEARFLSARELQVTAGALCRTTTVSARNIIVATGTMQTSMGRGPGLGKSQRPESLLHGTAFPEKLHFVGAGDFVAGLAAVVSLMGVKTELTTRDDAGSAVQELARMAGVRMNCGRSAMAIDPATTGIIDCRRETGITSHLNLHAIGVQPDENSQLWCSGNLETWCAGVYGIGDVVGFCSDSLTSPARQAARVFETIVSRVPRPHFLGVARRVLPVTSRTAPAERRRGGIAG